MAKRKQSSTREAILKCSAYRSGRKWTVKRMAAQTDRTPQEVTGAVTDMRGQGEVELVARNLKAGRYTCYYAKPVCKQIHFVRKPDFFGGSLPFQNIHAR